MARAKINLTCGKCGREFTHIKQNCHNRTAADSYEAWAKANIDTCPECYGAAKAAKKEAERTATAQKAAEQVQGCPLDLPTLTGSDKQIAWATDIRNKFVGYCMSKLDWAKMQEAAKDRPEVKADLDKLLAASAKWWIDNRCGTIFGRSISQG